MHDGMVAMGSRALNSAPNVGNDGHEVEWAENGGRIQP